MIEKGSSFAKDVDDYNRRNKADIELRKCLRCIQFDKSIYQCKLKKCMNKRGK